MSAVTPIVTVAALSHTYGDDARARPVLSDLSLAVRPGEIVMLTGPSGSGKTTLLTLLGAIRTLQRGSIKLWETELAGLSPAAQVAMRRRLGFIFQEHNLFESLTARQNVALSAGFATHPEGDCGDAMLAAVGLGELGHRLPRELSSGQRQRVAIARALAHRPGLVLADEPTAALDQVTGRAIVGLLRRQADTAGLAVVLVTHDSRIFPFADRLLNLVDGRLEADLHLPTLVRLSRFLRTGGAFPTLSPAAFIEVVRAHRVVELAGGARIDGAGVMLDGTAEAAGRAPLGPGSHFGLAGFPHDSATSAVTLRITSARARIALIDAAAYSAAIARARTGDEQELLQLCHSLL